MDEQQSNPPSPASESKLQRRLIAAVLLVAAVGPFIRTLAFGFVYDDTWIAQHNLAIVGWKSLLTLWQHPYWTDAEGAQAGLYRPVQTALLAIIRNAGGGWPIWFHLYALLLHAITTLLVWRLLARATGRWPAALAALWFAVHPVHVEAVANISNSAEPLVALWTLALYFVFARVGDRISWRQALLAAMLFVLAMLSKESGAMSLPIALLAAEAWRVRRKAADPRAATESTHRPLHALWRRWQPAMVVAVIAIALIGLMRWIVLGTSVHGASMAAVGIEHMSALERIGAMLSLGPLVFGLLIWPRAQNPYYGPSSFPSGSGALVAATLTIVTLVLAVLGAVRLARQPKSPAGRDVRPLAAIGWTLLAFLPASNLLVATGQILAERTLYTPSIGVAMLLAWGMDRFATAMAQGQWLVSARPRAARMATAVGSVAVIAVCARLAALAQRGAAAWRTHRALIDQMIAADPRGYRGHYLLALELRRGQAVDSIAHEFATAYALYPRDPQLNFDYARFLLEHHQPAEAVHVARELMDDPRMRRDADAIAVFLEARGQTFGADSVLVVASRLYGVEPHPTLALYLGLAHEARAERGAALNAYRAGLRLAPGDSVLTAHVTKLQ
ncbi:MAG TPA: glycosyltransferase family 39 protein [Gemmatimonadaceae bacterium]|nr:glycosyltransferase family 39 protein [Gemmatimonadaceae bacterium]